ncbi:MAG: long-chain fatty acid--CoA ligase [Trueperaceae bacterium]|nr:long-chain fatty acid--CoA ligase [Trueperaceae bacterium]
MQSEWLVADSLPALLRRRAKDDSIAFRVKRLGLWQSLRWSEYVDKVNALAAKLADLGVQPGDRVALLCENRPEWLISDLAIQTAGAVTVGVYTTSSAEQLAYYLNHSDSVGLIVEDAEQLEKWLNCQTQCPNLKWVAVVEPSDEVTGVLEFDALVDEGRGLYRSRPEVVDTRLNAVKPHDPALFIYTSGTTGNPKGAVLSHANLLWAMDSLNIHSPLSAKDELISFLPLSHIVERLISVAAPLRYGYTVSFTENLDTVMTNLQEIRPTIFFAVPRIWEKIHSLVELHMKDAQALKRAAYKWAMQVASKQRGASVSERRGAALLAAHTLVIRLLKYRLGLDRVRVAISGAAPISPDILAYVMSLGIDIREGFGLTESTGLIAINPAKTRLGTVGTAFPGVEIKIADDGEILSKSPGNFLHYYKDPEATAEALEDGWLHTGDVGELDADGYLSITDRKKDIIITAGGKNIAPQKIENQLKSSVYINDAVVIGDRRPYLTALLVLDEDNVSHWAAERQLAYSTYTDLTQNPEVIALIGAEVENVNATLARVETIKKFKILPKRLHHEDGEVTATLKVKRASIAGKYGHLIEELYG